MKNNNTENNIMNFDDTVKADNERAEIGKRHITDIAMTTSNDFSVIDSLMSILELFTVKDASFSTRDLANELQDYLFRWTKEYGNAVDAWKDSVLCGEKYKDADEEQESELASQSETANQSETAKQVSDLLNDPNLPEPIKEALGEGLTDMFNSRIDQSEIIEWQKTPEYVEKILRGYGAKNKTK